MLNVFTDNTPTVTRLAIWTDFTRAVPRRVYVTHGISLAVVKYVGDFLLVYAATGTLWTPADYIQALPMLFAQAQAAGWATSWLAPAMAVWTLPFVTLGVALTMRRAIDAGGSPWVSVLFLVPYVNYLVIATLAVLPTRPARRPEAAVEHNGRPAAAPAIVLGVSVALLAVGIGVKTINSYGAWLFVLTPFATGAVSGFVYNRRHPTSSRDTTALVFVTLFVAAAALLFFALEGAICVLMSFPLAFPLAILGGTVGRRAAAADAGSRAPAAFMLLAVPLTAAIEPPSGHVVHEVRSSVVIAAPPDAVWPHVVAFRDLAPPTDWVFRSGVAYPIRARIEGSGVGAVRYCEFSTGAFVEPITRWEPGRRLAFDVVESPPPMQELSPYRNLSPPHLHGYLRSKHGEFRLIDLGGRTRLEGSTWYELEMAPEPYWAILSDALIHRIHGRVLEHIKREVEGGNRRVPA